MSIELITQQIKRGNFDKAAELMVRNSRAVASDRRRDVQSEKRILQIAEARSKIRQNEPTKLKQTIYQLLPYEKFNNMTSTEYQELIDLISNDSEVLDFVAKDTSVDTSFPEYSMENLDE